MNPLKEVVVKRRPAKLSVVNAVKTSPASRRTRVENTGVFGSQRRPALRGVSDYVAVTTRQNAKAARRAEREWLKTLPKGVIV